MGCCSCPEEIPWPDGQGIAPLFCERCGSGPVSLFKGGGSPWLCVGCSTPDANLPTRIIKNKLDDTGEFYNKN